MTYEDRINWLKALGLREEDAKIFWRDACDDAGMLYDAAQNICSVHIAQCHTTTTIISEKKIALTKFAFLVPQ